MREGEHGREQAPKIEGVLIDEYQPDGQQRPPESVGEERHRGIQLSGNCLGLSLRGCARTKHACCALSAWRACVSLRGCARTKHACFAGERCLHRAEPAGSICTAAVTICGRQCRLTSGRGITSRVGVPATSRVGRLVRIMHACFVGADRRARTHRHAGPTEMISGSSGMSSGNKMLESQPTKSVLTVDLAITRPNGLPA